MQLAFLKGEHDVRLPTYPPLGRDFATLPLRVLASP